MPICPKCNQVINKLKILEYQFDFYLKNNEVVHDFIIGDQYYCCPECLSVLFKNYYDAYKFLGGK